MDIPVHLASGLTVRAATWDDLPDVAALLEASDVHDWGQPDTSKDELRSEWRNPELDLAKDTWLVHDLEGRLAGYGWQLGRAEHTRLDGWNDVHPDHRGRGVGSVLVDAAEVRAAEHRALARRDRDVEFEISTVGDGGGPKLLAARGFRNARHFWRMEIDLVADDVGPAPASPAGIHIRTFVRQTDARAAHAAIGESFASHYGFVTRPFEDWVTHRLDDPSFDPTLWFVAIDGEDVVGALVGALTEGRGWVHTLGVRAPWRGRGIGESLLRRSFAAFASKGIQRVALGVDSENETGATRLYERVGMRVSRSYESFVKVLPAPSPA